MPSTIFLNYRRQNEAGYAHALFSRLEQAFPSGDVFMDRDGLKPGDHFPKTLDQRVAECRVMLVLIGRGWIDVKDASGQNRLLKPDDFVRREIASALDLGKRVIPVLLPGSEVPPEEALPEPLKPLARLQAVQLTDEQFSGEAASLINAIKDMLATAAQAETLKAAEIPFLVDKYKVALEVEPLNETSEFDFPFGYGFPPPNKRREPLITNNKAHVKKTVTFADHNLCTNVAFELSYRTHNHGLIRINNNDEVSDPRINTFLTLPKDRSTRAWRFNRMGDDVMFLFMPARKTYVLDLDVYKGFDKEERNLTCHLPGNTRYARIKVTLSLSKYSAGTYRLTEGPTLWFWTSDRPEECESPEKHATLESTDVVKPSKANTDTRNWEWVIPSPQPGVIYLAWKFDD